MKYPAIERESLKPVMDELTQQIKPILAESKTDDEKEAYKVLIGTLLNLVSDIFSYLPPEDQSHILVTCGTWFDVGLLMGKSPSKLVEVLNNANPAIEEIEVPEWMLSMIGESHD